MSFRGKQTDASEDRTVNEVDIPEVTELVERLDDAVSELTIANTAMAGNIESLDRQVADLNGQVADLSQRLADAQDTISRIQT